MNQCNRPGCGGELDATGYCRRCLVPPLVAAPTGGGRSPAGERAPGRSVPVSTKRGTVPSARPAELGPPPRPFGDGPWWGLGLVTLPTIAGPEPTRAVRAAPRIPEERRLCPDPACRRPVGTGLDGQSSLLEGRCPYDGTAYSFVPRLSRGDLLSDRYRVEGCIGHGGFGWVYLAYDERLNNRPVALKGLIDSEDPTRVEEAAEEKRFLIELRHDDIVDIYDFVTHEPAGGSRHGYHGYLVMEYVPGYSLERPELFGLLETEQVVGYVLRVLRAFQYLHDSQYLFCDLKPSNLMVYGSRIKLIDLGAVREAGAVGSGAYSEDYMAPELMVTGPTVATDLHTVGRTLESLFRWYTADPDRARFTSLRRLISRATHVDPQLRFASAAEMAGQLSGVLRELVSTRDSTQYTAPSLLFARSTTLIDPGLGAVPPLDRWTSTAALRAAVEGSCRPLATAPPAPVTAAAGLPEPLVDARDSAAGFLRASVSTDPAVALSQLAPYADPDPASARDSSPEVELLRCRLHLRLDDLGAARAALDRARDLLRPGWRLNWHEGLMALAEQQFGGAEKMFTSCHQMLPGELAPQLALALCAEYRAATDEEVDAAAAAYLSVWRTDSWHESAAFGHARTRLRRGDRAGAVSALRQIPDTSPHHRAARIAALRIHTGRLDAGPEGLPDRADLTEARQVLATLPLDEPERRRLAALILEARLDRRRTSRPDRTASDDEVEVEVEVTEHGLRLELEKEYRAFAHGAPDGNRHTVLVDLANAVRPVTTQ
ncbi:serine/threonine-protein kinase [Streptomyces sp. BE303]|uniref:serine/threonine-protein kinase n=1 Tax=Streptomyces sp. BE303 TaxID=3002528 RepID=UPI002E78722B|nr:tetratricopeptide repeat protein [Streptomyces sp. BE303]MED7947871.1 tetratricopeptide repeat protein [Streptomyces sp. BE303]